MQNYSIILYLGGKIEFRISSVCCKFLESIGCSFLVDVGLVNGAEVSIGVGDVDFNALALIINFKV